MFERETVLEASEARATTRSTASVAMQALGIGTVVIGIWIVPPIGTAVLLVLALFSLKSDKSAVQAVTLTWLLTSLNPEIYTDPSLALRWLVLLVAGLGLLRRTGFGGLTRVFEKYSGLLVIGGVALASSLMSAYPALAIFKLIGFLLGSVVILGIFGTGRSLDARWLGRWFMSLFWAVVVLSAPLVITHLGYVRDPRLFQGILNHPQAMGVFLAPYVAGSVLVIIRRGPTAAGVLAATGSVAMLYATGARTGMLAAGVGIIIALAVGFMSNRPEVRFGRAEKRRALTMFASTVFVLVILVQILGAAPLQDTFMKRGRGGNDIAVIEAFRSSRGFLVERSLTRFRESPFVGMGFGVPPNVDRTEVKTVLGGVPIGASTEPGIAITGLLEEVGILGLLAFVLLIYQVMRPILKGISVVAVALAGAALWTNVGESAIWSFGGVGLFVWLMIGWAMVISRQRPMADFRR